VEWHPFGERFPNLRVFIYGTNENALIYTYDRSSNVLTLELAVRNGRIVP
jgi:hypothetical protein